MPQQFDDDFEDDDDTFEDDGGSNLVRDLRKQLKQATRERKALAAENATLKNQGRERTIAEVLAAKGLDRRVAKFMPADLEPTPEKVEEWIGEYGDLFGAKPQETASSQEAQAPDPNMASHERMKAVEEVSSPAGGNEALMQRLQASGNANDVLDIMRQFGRTPV